MRLSRMWTLRRDPGADGLEHAETEATLREALVEETAAPGEDDSYRRLMAVIADDMRLRQPAPRRPAWGWVPALSASATVAILLVFAYSAGVDNGRRLVDNGPPPISRPVDDGVVPHGQYIPPAPSVPPSSSPEARPAPRLSVEELPDASPMNYIGNLLLEGLSREQRELVRVFNEQAKAEHWENAARTLEDLAGLDISSEAAVKALHGAAVIYQNRVKDDAQALRLYEREAEALERQIGEATSPEQQAALEKQRELALTSINALRATPDNQ